MTRFDKEQQIATIKATSQVAKYFEKDMKKFLPSQEFREKLDDGSVIFTVSYTQSLEILPFVQKWLPDLIILEPRELKEQYRKKIQQIFKNLN
jgi:predicted DNA-binding transcriptional regulator YafY